MKRSISLSMLPLLCCLALLLAACASQASNKPVPTVASAPPATAVPAARPTAALNPAFALFKGMGYSITYPKTWKVTKSVNAVTFSDPSGTADFVVQLIPNPNGSIQPQKAIGMALSGVQKAGKNYKTLTLSPTVSLNGVVWYQGGASADISSNGRLQSGKVITLATNHPAHAGATTLFSIVYAGPVRSFEATSNAAFLPMLNSFKFA